MCCFILSLLLVGPRLAFLVFWLIKPDQIQQAFNGWFGPVMGVIFLPWTTLLWVIVYGPNGVDGFSWFVVGIGLAADILSYTSGAYKRRSIPYYSDTLP